MKISQVMALGGLLTTAAIAQPVQAATLTPTEQVDTVVRWFTGLFDNGDQVASDPTVPFLTMENCEVSAEGYGSPSAQYVHLEQYIGGAALLRTAAYEFSPGVAGVDLSVYGYLDDTAALGSCDRTTLDFASLELPSCDIDLAYEPSRFVGSNAPTGCATSFPVSGSRVVSTVTIAADTTVSFDEFFTPFGTSFGTPIRFERAAVATPEPFSLAALVVLGLGGLVRRRR